MDLKLYKKDAAGTIRIWTIFRSDDDEISMEYGVLGGAMQVKRESIVPKAGRTMDDQVLLQMGARITKARDTGYVDTLEDAANNKRTNARDLPLPMLATPYAKIKSKPETFFLQYKYDGNRCIIGKVDGKIVAYSRKGREFKSIDHIKEACKDIPEGMFLDGELYKHGVPLQTLRSWISKKQAESNQLEYICYDYISDSVGFLERLRILENLDLYYPISLASTALLTTLDAELEPINSRLSKAIELGYEGLIMRTLDGRYEDGKRSKNLIKIKRWEDAEFTVIGITPSADGWAILECKIGDSSFSVSAPGTMEQKTEVYENRENYIGKKITVEYANLTPYGIPFHPVAIAWREDHE